MFDPHPYEILELDPTASNAEILKAFATAMQRKQYSPDILVRARKALMDPVDRPILDYLWGNWRQKTPASNPNPAVLDILTTKIAQLEQSIDHLAHSHQLTPASMDEEILIVDRLLSSIVQNTINHP
jgi:hypothetical protein